MRLQLDEDNIVWPGGLTQKPTGLMIPTHLKVLTILEKPFVYARQIEKNQTCDPALGETRCPLYNTKQSDNIGKIYFIFKF
jgi:ionotropic glutamate receptor NMDA 1